MEKKLKDIYSVIFTRTEDKKDTYLVEVPQLNILTEGHGLDDAIDMARDSIGEKILTIELAGKSAPQIDYEVSLDDSVFREEGTQTLSFVDVDMNDFRRKHDKRTVRRNVTLPGWLDYEAKKAGINVSGLLQEALIQKLGL